MRCIRKWFAAALVAGALCGCSNGDGRLTTKGRIVKGGAPFTVTEPEFVRVTFFPMTSDGAPPRNTYLAAFSPSDGTFRAVGPDGKGLPPGKYRIAVEHNRKRSDLFKGAYDGDRSPFVFDIDSSTPEIVIDLDAK
jgi:hypothetical protein